MVKELKQGDIWPYHYRGAKYHYNKAEEVWWAAPLKLDKVFCTKGHENIVQKLLEVKPTGGSFRVTENRDIITKMIDAEDENDEYESYYVGKLEDDLVFEDVDINPAGIRYGDLWTGFYDGASYHFNSVGKIWWRDSYGRRWFVKYQNNELSETLLQWKKMGGSFRVNEYGKVISLLERVPYPEHIDAQMKNLNDRQRNIIEYKVESTELAPIYICDFQGKFELEEPFDMKKQWTEEETAGFIDKLKNLGR